MKRKFVTILIFLSLLNLSPIAAQSETVAVLDFSNNCLFDKEKYASLSSGLAEIMITELSSVKSLTFVERQKINALIQEMQLAQSGLVSEETGVQVGKLVGAKYLIFGSYMVFENKIRVDARIVEVETGLTIKAEEVTQKVSKMFDIIKELNSKILKDLDINLSKEERQLLDAGDTPSEVIELFSKGLEYEETKNIEKAKQFYIQAFKLDKNFRPVRKKLKALLTLEDINK